MEECKEAGNHRPESVRAAQPRGRYPLRARASMDGSALLDLGGGAVERDRDRADLLLRERSARHADAERHSEVLHRAQNLRRWTAAIGGTHLAHAGQDPPDRAAMGVEVSRALRGYCVELLAAVAGCDGGMAELLEHGERGIDHAGARAVRAAELVFDCLDELVAVPRLLRDQLQDEQL